MPTLEGSITVLTFVIAIIGCVVSVSGVNSRQRNEVKKEEHYITTISTKLDFISEDVKDVKADQRSFQRDINEIRTIAMNAKERADAAHRRLDRIGLDLEERGTNTK